MFQNLSNLVGVTENQVKFSCRAKYVPTSDGGYRLAMIQQMSQPVFTLDGWELDKNPDKVKPEKRLSLQDVKDSNYIIRSSRRARIAAFDYILCNADINAFATFTYAPENIDDRTSYDDCYNVIRGWLSNRVQRNGLKYVAVPERHKKGGIHFHALMNSSALSFAPAYNPNTGAPIKHNRRQIYNLADWQYGYSTLELINNADSDRVAVSKYIFKYMAKQEGKIGGRYFLHGGELATPKYVYANTVEELTADEKPLYTREVKVTPKVVYREYSFL